SLLLGSCRDRETTSRWGREAENATIFVLSSNAPPLLKFLSQFPLLQSTLSAYASSSIGFAPAKRHAAVQSKGPRRKSRFSHRGHVPSRHDAYARVSRDTTRGLRACPRRSWTVQEAPLSRPSGPVLDTE
ncbi:unnamed protein product, partial [Scytosiphon promiscuus]